MQRRNLVGPIAVALLACACGGGDPGPSGGVCTAGATQVCSGDRGCAGSQQCLADGTGWGACACPGSPDSGAPDAGSDAGPADAGNLDGGVADAGTDAGSPDAGPPKSATIGAAGGTLTFNGSIGAVTLVVPAGALSSDQTIAIAEAGGAPAGYAAFSPVYQFTPAGLTFAKPATVTMPFLGDATLAAGFWSRTSGPGYDRLDTALAGKQATVKITHFSSAFVGNGVDYTDPSSATCTRTRLIQGRTTAPSAVSLLLSVEDCNGNPITTLTPDKFTLTEDGRPASIEASSTVLQRQGLEVFVSLVIDVSQSSAASLGNLSTAATAFVDKLKAQSVPAQVSIQLFAGDASLKEWQHSTLDLDLVKQRLGAIATWKPTDPSSTNLNGAVLQAIDQLAADEAAFEGRNNGGAAAVGYAIVFTAGRDTSALTSAGEVGLHECVPLPASEQLCSMGQSINGSVYNAGGSCSSPAAPLTCPNGTCCPLNTNCVSSGAVGGYSCVPVNTVACQNATVACPALNTCGAPNVGGATNCCCTTQACRDALLKASCRRPVSVVGVGLQGPDFDVAGLRAVSNAGVFTPSDVNGLVGDFAYLANRIAGQSKSTYLLGYCSPSRAGSHAVSVTVGATQDPAPGAPAAASYQFSAAGFGPGCGAAFFAGACKDASGAQAECGGLFCGGCDDRSAACDGRTLQCDDFCSGHCGQITNPNGYAQACPDTPTNTFCDGTCIDTTSDPANCGRCRNVCSQEGASTSCVASACVFACLVGRGDCDGNPANACESVLATDIANCGACNRRCTTAPPNGVPLCDASNCSFSCRTGFVNCDGNSANGCESQPDTDSMNCGACGNVCSAHANTSGVCAGAKCACRSGFADCDHNAANGCEVDLTSNALNCNSCGNACPGGSQGTNLAGACVSGSCSLVCAEGWIDCDGNTANGCESSTALNCGACGRSCLGATCSLGNCGIIVLGKTQSPIGLAVDATSVYWADQASGTVMSAPLAGGKAKIVASGQSSPGSIATDSVNLYWANNGNGNPYTGAIMTWPLAGGAAVSLASGEALPAKLAIDGSNVYWVSGAGMVKKMPLKGGTPVTLNLSAGRNDSIAIDATSVYWVNNEVSGSIKKVALTGGPATTLASGLVNPHDLVVDGTSVYWTNYGQLSRNIVDGTVMKMPLAGGTPTILASGLAGPYAIAVDGTFVYWSTIGTGGIWKLPLSGGTPVMFAGPDLQGTGNEATAIALDADSVLWTNATSILRLAK